MISVLDAAIAIRKQREAQTKQDAMAAYRAGLIEKRRVATEAKENRRKERALSLKEEARVYKNLVWRLTETNSDLASIPNYHLRKWLEYDLDHIISIWEGFQRGIPAHLLADVTNLRIITHAENSSKGKTSHYDANPVSEQIIPVEERWQELDFDIEKWRKETGKAA